MHQDAPVTQRAAFRDSKQFTWYNFRICFLISLAQVGFGYPASIISTTMGQPSFLLYMGLIDPITSLPTGHASQIEGAMSAVFFAGSVCGVLTSSFVLDRWGRKAGVIFCSFFSLIGGIMCCAAQNPAMFIVFRFWVGVGANAFVPVTAVYTSELAPPALRGFFGGLNGILILVGYSLASYMGLAFFHSKDPSAQWRAPLGLALIFPALMLLLLPILPESPRWLLLQGRPDEAERVVQKLHQGGGSGDEFARSEFYQMRRQADHDRTMNSSWKEMFFRASYRRRAVIVMLIGAFGQASGVIVINNFSPLIYRALGFDTEETLILLCGWITGGIFASLIGAWLMDRWGRRPLIIFGFGGCCLCLVVVTIMIALFATPVPENPNKAAMGTAVAMLYLFIWIFAGCLDTALVVYLPELFPNHLRAKGMSLGIASLCLTDLVLLQVTPTAMRTIGWKFYLVFISVSAVALVWAYLTIPETKGLPLEEIAALFGEEYEVTVFAANIHVGHTNNHELVVEEVGELEHSDKAATRTKLEAQTTEHIEG